MALHCLARVNPARARILLLLCRQFISSSPERLDRGRLYLFIVCLDVGGFPSPLWLHWQQHEVIGNSQDLGPIKCRVNWSSDVFGRMFNVH